MYMVYAYSHTAYVNDAFAFACWRSSASYLTAAQPARAACYCNGDTHRHTRTQRQRGSVLLHKMKAIDGKTLPNTEIGSLFADKEWMEMKKENVLKKKEEKRVHFVVVNCA